MFLLFLLEKEIPMKKLLLLLALVVTQVVFAQYTNFYDEGRIGSQVVNAFCQDADGFLWMATRNGLRRFDGSQFVAYYHSEQDSASLADNEVHSLLVDRNHDLWVGTASGLQRYLPEGDDFCQVSFHHIPTEGRIWDIIQLHDGTVLCAIANEGVFRVDSHAMQGYPMLVESKVFTPRNVCVLFEDSHGRLWIGTDREGVVRVDLATQAERLYQLGASRIRNIVEDADGRILVVTSQAIFRWEEQDDRFYRLPYVGKKGNVQYRSALLTAGGEVIVGTYGQGFVCVKQGSEEVVDTDGFGCVAIDVDKAKVNALFEDRYQNVWAGCQYQGVLLRQQRPMPFAFWKSPAASGNPGWINVLYCDKQGDVWCAVESNGIYQLDAYGNNFGIYPCPRRCFRCLKTVTGHFGWVWMEEGFTHSTRRRGG